MGQFWLHVTGKRLDARAEVEAAVKR